MYFKSCFEIRMKKKMMIEDEDELYLQIQKTLRPMRIQTILCTYMMMGGTVLLCIQQCDSLLNLTEAMIKQRRRCI